MRARCWMVATAAAAAAAWSPVVVSAASCPALDYQARLAAAAASLAAPSPDVGGARAAVASLLAAVPSARPALQPVLDDLSVQPPQLDDATSRLSGMSATLAYPPHSTCVVDATPAESALHDVYGSPAFRHLDDTAQGNLLDTILGFISSLFSRAAGALGPGGAALVGLLVLVAALWLAWRRWHAAAPGSDAAVRELAEVGDDPDREWAIAERAAARADYREAVRRAFRATLIDVALSGGVRIDAAWTTRELLPRCRASGDALAALVAAAALFEQAWYSGRPVDAAAWAQARDRCATARRLARASRGARV